MRGQEGPYPWNDSGHAEREYLRTWKGMPLRSDWNASPGLRYCQTCTSCGYRWDEQDFVYRSDVLVNGEPAGVALHRRCWNCFMCETQPHQVQKHWDSVERTNTAGFSQRAKQGPRLQKLEGVVNG